VTQRAPRIGLIATGGLVLVWVIGQIFRERFGLTGLCFFIPSPLIAVIGLAAAFRYRRKGLLHQCRWALALAAVPLLAVVAIENHWTARQAMKSGPNTMRLVHWNVWHGTLGRPGIGAVLAEYNADICVLSEPPDTIDFDTIDQRTDTGYNTVRVGDMAVIACGTLTREATFRIGEGSGGLLSWNNKNQTISLLVADLPSRITAARGPMLMELQRRIDEHHPDIIVGDLNSPRRCHSLANLPRGYAHAYDTAGKGWSYTWPAICPLWAIDHCMTGPRIRTLHYSLRSTTVSDHRLQCLDFEIDSTLENRSNGQRAIVRSRLAHTCRQHSSRGARMTTLRQARPRWRFGLVCVHALRGRQTRISPLPGTDVSPQ
jgi:vancomycin resistance protein VanJ